MYIYTAGRPSNGAKALARALPAKRVEHPDNAKKNPTALIINWGSANLGYDGNPRILNQPAKVKAASNKLSFFKLNEIKDLVPWWTESKEEADKHLDLTGGAIVCRTVLNGHSGDGIVIARSKAELVDAPLYVQYISKKWEFRVHCFNFPLNGEEAIDFQQKARRKEVPDDEVNWQVRNHKNGFIYKRQLDVPEAVKATVGTAAMRAFLLTGLDFGAVDVIYNVKQERAYVLEINTAPGLEGTTIDSYVSAFRARKEM